jgi:hypothetical protein
MDRFDGIETTREGRQRGTLVLVGEVLTDEMHLLTPQSRAFGVGIVELSHQLTYSRCSKVEFLD